MNTQLLNAYPHCAIAVEWCETILESIGYFGMMRDRTASVEHVLELVKLRLALAEFECFNANDSAGEAAMIKARREAEHSSFRDYISAKMGMF